EIRRVQTAQHGRPLTSGTGAVTAIVARPEPAQSRGPKAQMVNGTSENGEKRSDRKVAESIARDIVRTIVDNELPPGTPLPAEAEMIADYAVGRAALREALRLLETQGVIPLRRGPGGGPFVAEVTARDFAEPMALHLEIAR